MGKLKKAIKTAPETIWLQISDDTDHFEEAFPYEEEITWCQDTVMNCEIEYRRSDIATSNISEAKALRALIEGLEEDKVLGSNASENLRGMAGGYNNAIRYVKNEAKKIGANNV